jgi:outer membrane protein, multidrug efflux system
MNHRNLRRRASLVTAAIVSTLGLSAAAVAQPAPGAPAPKPAAPAAPAAPAGGGIMSTVPVSPVELHDDMLASVPPADHVLGSWKEALHFILQRSTNLATALQEVERAEGNARVALAGVLPTITGTVNATGQIVTGRAPSTNIQLPNGGTSVVQGTTLPPVNPAVFGSLAIVQPIFAPRAWYAVRTGRLGVATAQLTVEDQKRTIFTSVATSIIAVFTAERTAETNRQGLKSALQVQVLTERQFKLGAGATRLDVLRAQQSAETARATLVSGDEALIEAREALGLALGFSYPYGVPATLSLTEIEGTVRGVCKPGPLDERADILAARNNLEIAKRGITDAWLAFSPTATLSTTASLENSGALQPDGHIGAWNVVGVLSIPLWEGGARYGNLRIAKVQVEETKLTLEAAIRTANVAIAQALRSVAVAEQERTVSERSRNLARDLARLTMATYVLGTATNFDLVNTEQTWRAAELDLIVKEFAVIQAKLNAVLATSNCNY